MELYLLAIDWTKLADPGAIIALALTAMFLVLLVLTTVLKFVGKTPDEEEEESAPAPVSAVKVAAPAVAAAAPVVGNTETVRSKPDVDGGIPEETVAVISAAVASVAPAGSQYAVKGIRKL